MSRGNKAQKLNSDILPREGILQLRGRGGGDEGCIEFKTAKFGGEIALQDH